MYTEQYQPPELESLDNFLSRMSNWYDATGLIFQSGIAYVFVLMELDIVAYFIFLIFIFYNIANWIHDFLFQREQRTRHTHLRFYVNCKQCQQIGPFSEFYAHQKHKIDESRLIAFNTSCKNKESWIQDFVKKGYDKERAEKDIRIMRQVDLNAIINLLKKRSNYFYTKRNYEESNRLNQLVIEMENKTDEYLWKEILLKDEKST